VAFVGSIGSGKTTMCESIAVEHYGQPTNGTIRISFADALRDEVAYALHKSDPKKSKATVGRFVRLPIDTWRERLADPETKATYRPLMQWWGTEYRRAEDPDYWVSQWEEKADKAIAAGYTVLVDDCRFDNEYRALKLRNFLIVGLDSRPGDVRNSETPRTLTTTTHASEVEWRTFDRHVQLAWLDPIKRMEVFREVAGIQSRRYTRALES